jgi:hypothetical protein
MEIKNIVLLVVFILGIVFMQFVQAQTADEIINKYIDARGGKEKISAMKTLYMEGSRQMMGNEVAVKVAVVQDKLFRTDFQFGGTAGYTIITPTEGWSFIPMRSQNVDPIPAERLKAMQGQLDIAGPLFNYLEKGNKAELQEKETVDGKDAYKIKLTSSTGKAVTYYIDTKSFLLLQSKQLNSAMGNGVPQEVVTNYSDYTLIDGIMFPQTIANPGGGMNGGSTTFDIIVVNKTISDDQYKPSK